MSRDENDERQSTPEAELRRRMPYDLAIITTTTEIDNQIDDGDGSFGDELDKLVRIARARRGTVTCLVTVHYDDDYNDE